MKSEIGKPKFEYKSFAVDKEIYNEIELNFKQRMYQDVQAQNKEVRDANIEKISEDILNYFIEKKWRRICTRKANRHSRKHT